VSWIYVAEVCFCNHGVNTKEGEIKKEERKTNYRVANFSHGVHGYLYAGPNRVIYVSFIIYIYKCVYVWTGRSNNGVWEKIHIVEEYIARLRRRLGILFPMIRGVHK